MSYKLIFHPEIHNDIKETLEWYESAGSKIALDFEAELIRCYERIANNPLSYFILHKKLKIRRALLYKFPYKLIFQVQKNKIIWIVSLIHHKRKKKKKKRFR